MFKFIDKLINPYKYSTYRAQYEKIADEYYLSPNRVQKLAHGASPRSVEEYKAKDALKEAGIITHNSH